MECLGMGLANLRGVWTVMGPFLQSLDIMRPPADRVAVSDGCITIHACKQFEQSQSREKHHGLIEVGVHS